MIDHRLRRHERLTKRADFETIFREGIRYSTRHFFITIYQTNLDVRRLGMVVSRKVGGAVKRNRVKRLVREFFRLNKHRLPEGHDIVFIAKPNSIELDYVALTEEMLEFFGRLSTT